MSALTAIPTGALILAAIAYELARLITPDESRFRHWPASSRAPGAEPANPTDAWRARRSP